MPQMQKGKQPEEVMGGTASLLSLAGSMVIVFAYMTAGPNPGGESNLLVTTIVLTIFAIMTMSVVKPCSKRAFGANWIFVAPGVLVALEAGQAAIFLQARLSDTGFYVTLLFQLGYSFFKNVRLGVCALALATRRGTESSCALHRPESSWT